MKCAFRLISTAVVFSLLGSSAARAQVVQDPTLGTQVTRSGNTFSIRDGTTVGPNLFHSFQDFNIPPGAIVDFRNETSIINILARVTGGSRSDIFGQIRAQGNANLFLMNPSGIYFGQNSVVGPRLLMNGSFTATTANAILFPNNGQFSLTSSITPQNESLLRVNPSALLFNQLPQALSAVQASQTFLRVAPGQNLLLVGGDVNLSGSGLTALGGRIDIAAIANGTIELITDNLNRPHLSVPSDVLRAAVRITGSTINANGTSRIGGNGGSIQINATTIDAVPTPLNSTSAIIPSSFSVNRVQNGTAGVILMNASDRISLVQAKLSSDGAATAGNAASLSLHAGNLIELVDGTTLSSQISSAGVGGNIQIKGRSIRLADEGTSLLTNSFGPSKAGDVAIEATQDVQITGGSTISTVAQEGASNAAGNIHIRANSFTLSQGSQLATNSLGPGKAGDVIIWVQQAGLTTNGQIIANTAGSGQGGTVRVQARNLVLSQNGQISSATSSSGNAGDIQITADAVALQGPKTGLFASTTQGSTGNGGNITLNSARVSIQNGGRIAVNSEGSGTGGSIKIETGRLTLNNGLITTETASTDGGNLTLQTSDLLLLRNQSLISASAGTDRAGGNGGQIMIRSPFVVSVLAENSDIRANAYSGRGGTVTIDTQGVFGIQAQPSNTPQSDITASSQFGISGVVTINTLNVDPSQGLVALPSGPVDPTNQIAQGCGAQNQVTGTFVVTGRGGLPESPNELLRDQAVSAAWVTLDRNLQAGERTQIRSQANQELSHPAIKVAAAKLTEAQGWIKNEQGDVYLVALPAHVNATPPIKSANCPSP